MVKNDELEEYTEYMDEGYEKSIKQVRGIYCNPIEWLDECAIGLRKWAKEPLK